MGTPSEHLPKPITHEAINALLQSLDLPEAVTITAGNVTAQYHGIYFVTLPTNDKTLHSELVLRVSGYHLPKIKTENEVGVMTWIACETTIPIPSLVAFDSSADNPIAHEYTLLSRAPGVTLTDVYESLSQKQLTNIIDQLLDFLCQLQAHTWDGIGGLVRNKKGGGAVLARVVDETFWQIPDIKALWPKTETIDSLNIGGPYSTYVEYVSDQIRTYVHLIKIHKKLEFMRDDIPLLEWLISALSKHADALRLNDVHLSLAHKDLHFANVLYDVSSGKITSILDWEFSGVVPFPKWNPRRAFLWNGLDNEKSGDEKQRLLAIFEKRCKEKGVCLLKDAEYSTPYQESMQKVADYLRAIVEVSPRGQRQDLVGSWRDTVMENIATFVKLPTKLQKQDTTKSQDQN
jgi:hypothetical protein